MGNSVVRVDGRAWQVQREVGGGGFSRVLEVRRGRERRALKWARGLAEREDAARARLEVDVMRRLHHRHCLTLEAAELRGDEALLLLPLLPRGSLQAALERAAAQGRAAFSEREALRFFALLLDAVAALHALGFAHRDLKPGNVLLSAHDPPEPVLMDFGSVAPLETPVRSFSDAKRLAETAARLSSAAYRAPELWEAGAAEVRGAVDGRADVWSLGCILHAMAFGPYSPFEHPRDGVQQLAILAGNASFESSSHSQTYSPTFVALIRWILTPDMAVRPTLDGVRQCVNQLLAAPAVPLETAAARITPMELVRRLSKQESWADFTAFEDPAEPEPAPAASATRKQSIRRRSSAKAAAIVRARRESRAMERDATEVSADDRRRALSLSGRQILKRALSGDQSSIV